MRIAILGCGAMGTVLGAYLTNSGCNVEMIDNYKEHVSALNKVGAKIIGKADLKTSVKAVTPDKMSGIYDVVFLLTKQTANEEVLTHLLSFLDENSTVCTLQNGVPEPNVAKYIGENRTIGGTILWGATFVGPGISELTQDIDANDHLFEIGEISGLITPRTQNVAKILDHMGKKTLITKTLMASRWGKLINNACMSGMSAACGSTFGEILDNDLARACLSYIGYEVKACCEAEGYILPTLVFGYAPDSFALKNQNMFEQNQELFLGMYEGARNAKASMLQDLEKGKLTEIAMINGFVSEIGKKHQIQTPFNDTVVAIVNKIEKGDLTLSLDNLKYFNKELLRFENYIVNV